MTNTSTVSPAFHLADRFEALAVRAESGEQTPSFTIDVLEALATAKIVHGYGSRHIGGGRKADLHDAAALRVTRDALRALA